MTTEMSDTEILARAVLSACLEEVFVAELKDYRWCCGFCGLPSPDHEDGCVTYLAKRILADAV